jgi:hypothetical protein
MKKLLLINFFIFKFSIQKFFKFKELMLSIDQEDSKTDEANKTGNNSKLNLTEMSKLSSIQQKLMEGIEKTKVPIQKNNNYIYNYY